MTALCSQADLRNKLRARHVHTERIDWRRLWIAVPIRAIRAICGEQPFLLRGFATLREGIPFPVSSRSRSILTTDHADFTDTSRDFFALPVLG